MLDSSEDRWEFWYGGLKINIDWNHKDIVGVNDSLIALWRHHLSEAVQVKSPPTIYSKFYTFVSIAQEMSANLSLTSMLAVFSRLHSEGRTQYFYDLRVFYNWGISHGIAVFDRRIQNIINDLPAPKKKSLCIHFFATKLCNS